MPQTVHVTFIHGLANKPAPNELRRIWLEALDVPHNGDQGFDLGAVGVTASFVYWADLFYDAPIAAAGYESRNDDLADSVKGDITLEEDAWIQAMRLKYPDDEKGYDDAPVDENTEGFERIPIPWFIKQKLIQHFVKEAHDYLFNTNGIRDQIRSRVMDDFKAVPAGARHVLVGHSQGAFITYDVLTGVAECKQIDGMMTLGSPLGADEIQDKLVWSRNNGFPEKLRGDWVNIYDPFDPVARFDPKLANDFKKNGEQVILDIKEENWGTWRHSATKYLKGSLLRKHLRRLCDREGA